MEPLSASWGARARAAIATLGSAPWRRAPWLLWRRPGLLVSTAGAGAVLAASLAAVPLFLSSAGTEAVALQAAERCPRDTGATYVIAPGPGSRLDAPDPFTPLVDELGPSIQWGRIETVLEGPGPSERTPVVVLFRDDAVTHLDVVEPTERSQGVWVSDRTVALTGVGASTEAVVGGIRTPVTGVYRDLSAGTITDPFWCAHRPDLLLQGADLEPPPPVLIADRETWLDLEATAVSEVVEAGWETPLLDEVTVTAARDLVADLDCDSAIAAELTWCRDRAEVTVDDGPGALSGQQVEPPNADGFVERYFESSVPFVAVRARSIQTAVGGGVWPVAVLAALAGAGLVAATALLWCDRRRREVALLTVRGVSPAAIGVKAVLELVGGLLIGTALGVGLAYGLVVGVGPSATLEPAAVGRAGWVGVIAFVASALVVGSVVAVRVTIGPAGHRRRRGLRFVPWEVALGLLTVVSFRRLEHWGVPVSRGARVSRIDVLGLMFPVLFLTTMVAVAARLLGLALGPLGPASRRWPSALFLAVRRVARHRGAVIGMVAASALATGVFGYAATVHRSMDASLHAKAQAYLGSDVVVRIPPDAPIPAALADRSTSVDYYSSAWVDVGERVQVNVFAIDPATFAQAAFWDPSLASVSLPEILDRFSVPRADGRVPAVLVGAELPATAAAGIVTSGTTELEVAEVAEVQAFPGMRRGSAALFVPADALEDLGLSSRAREVWIRGERTEVLGVLDDARTSYEEPTTAANVVDAMAFLTVSQTFGFMRSLAVAAALLVVGGVAVYFDARRRGRVLAYAFVRRMGLSRRQHRRALLVEVLAGVGVGCWLGLVVAVVGASVALERIDPLPLVRPVALLRPATGVLIGVGLAVLVLCGVAAALAQRATDRDDPVEVLRAGS